MSPHFRDLMEFTQPFTYSKPLPLVRRLHFLSDGSSWQGQYDYYHDALCKHPSFSLDAKGSYSGGSDSKLIPGAKDYSFRVRGE